MENNRKENTGDTPEILEEIDVWGTCIALPSRAYEDLFRGNWYDLRKRKWRIEPAVFYHGHSQDLMVHPDFYPQLAFLCSIQTQQTGLQLILRDEYLEEPVRVRHIRPLKGTQTLMFYACLGKDYLSGMRRSLSENAASDQILLSSVSPCSAHLNYCPHCTDNRNPPKE